MGGGGGGQTSTVSTQMDPQVAAQLNAIMQQANAAGQQAYQPYSGQRIAGLTEDQLAGQNLIRQSAGIGTDQFNQANAAYNAVLGYQPERVSARNADTHSNAAAGQGQYHSASAAQWNGDPAQYNAVTMDANARSAFNNNRNDVRNVAASQVSTQGLPQVDLSQYLNPYTQQVVNNTVNEINRSYDQTAQGLAGRAAMSGAFGGDRAAVEQAENNRNRANQIGDTTGALYQSGFNTAQNQAQTDLARALQAQGMNQQTGLQAQGMNQGVDQAMALANQQTGAQFGLANLGYQNQAALTNANTRNQQSMFNTNLNQQTNLANQQQQNAMEQFNAGQTTQTNLANQQAYNQGQQYNAQLDLQGQMANQQNSNTYNAQRLQAASGLAGLGNTMAGNGYTAGNALLGIGAQNQGLNQQNLSMAYSDFAAQRGWPQNQIGWQSQVLFGSPLSRQGTQSTTTPGPSTGSQIAGLGMAGLGAAASYFGSAQGGTVPYRYANGGMVQQAGIGYAYGGQTQRQQPDMFAQGAQMFKLGQQLAKAGSWIGRQLGTGGPNLGNFTLGSAAYNPVPAATEGLAQGLSGNMVAGAPDLAVAEGVAADTAGLASSLTGLAPEVVAPVETLASSVLPAATEGIAGALGGIGLGAAELAPAIMGGIGGAGAAGAFSAAEMLPALALLKDGGMVPGYTDGGPVLDDTLPGIGRYRFGGERRDPTDWDVNENGDSWGAVAPSEGIGMSYSPGRDLYRDDESYPSRDEREAELRREIEAEPLPQLPAPVTVNPHVNPPETEDDSDITPISDDDEDQYDDIAVPAGGEVDVTDDPEADVLASEDAPPVSDPSPSVPVAGLGRVKSSWGIPLMRMGLAMMAGKSPHALTNVGEAGVSTLDWLEQRRQRELQSQLRSDQIARQERRDLMNDRYHQGVLQNQQERNARMAAGNQGGATGYMVSMIRAENPGMSVADALKVLRNGGSDKYGESWRHHQLRAIGEAAKAAEASPAYRKDPLKAMNDALALRGLPTVSSLDEVRNIVASGGASAPQPAKPTATAKPPSSSPRKPAPAAAVEYLKQHPEMKAQFDAKYGAGAAAAAGVR